MAIQDTAGETGRRDRTHFLYIAVVVAVLLGIAVGLLAPDFAKQLRPLGTGFVNLIKMMISPVIFCTIVLGVGSVRHRPELVDGVGLIVGIDRFMSEARALTNFAGNAVATVLIGVWTGEFDREQADRVFAGHDPFDEVTMLGDVHHGVPDSPGSPGGSGRGVPEDRVSTGRACRRTPGRWRLSAQSNDPMGRRRIDRSA